MHAPLPRSRHDLDDLGLIELPAQPGDVLTLPTDAAVSAFPCTSRGGRGWPISTLVLDECAHFLDTDGNSAAETVWRALAPSTAQFGSEARVIVSSTPWGQDGLFANLYAQASSGELSDAVAHTSTTAAANPTIDVDFLASEEARDHDGFRSEYLALFVGGGAAFLDPERITDAVADRDELIPGQALGWVAGLDAAFSSDPFGLALVGRDPRDRQRLLLGVARAWTPSRRKNMSFEERRGVEDAVLAEVADLCRMYQARVVTDQYAAPAVVERLRRAGLVVRTIPMTAVSKTTAFGELRARLNTGGLELYEHHDLLAELRRLRTRYAAGSASVVNPRVGGSHGDLRRRSHSPVSRSRGSGAGRAPRTSTGILCPSRAASGTESPRMGRSSSAPWTSRLLSRRYIRQ